MPSHTAARSSGALAPRAFPNLRSVPAYADFIKDRFERCLDLYLCPRARKKTAWVEDAASLLPELPKPADLRPYPRRLAARLEAGMVGINSHMIGGADAPFGGVKWSGHGSEDGPEGVRACMVLKAVHEG